MDVIKKLIETDQEKRKLFEEIMEQNRIKWNNVLEPETIFKWLKNFNGENEKEYLYALKIANEIYYCDKKGIEQLWGYVVNNRMREYIHEKKFAECKTNEFIKNYIEYVNKSCVFVGYGEAGKSGNAMIYSLRNAIENSDFNFLTLDELYRENLETFSYVVLVDDFIGTGNQATKNWEKKREIDGEKISLEDIKKKYKNIEFLYIALIATREGKKKIEKNTSIKVFWGDVIDETYKCFSEVSRIFTDSEEREEAKEIIERKGKLLYEHPLGYENGQLTIAFEHNTPNNSLPVIWKKIRNGGWFPLFERKK